MASIITRKKDGTRLIQVVVDRERKFLYLGHCTKRTAESVLSRIEALDEARRFNVKPDVETINWLQSVPDQLHRALFRAGLCGDRIQVAEPMLGEFVDEFLARYPESDTETKITLRTAYRRLLKHFGKARRIRTISVADAQQFRASLVEAEYATATISATVKKVRQLWTAALERGLVAANVWNDVEAGEQSNAKRAYYVTVANAAKILKACPDDEWRLIFALARFAGLRCPSELWRLDRGDVDLDGLRFTVHGKGKRDRTVPIFASLQQPMAAICRRVKAGPLIRRRGISGTALRHQFERIVRRAGLVQWPRLFHNLRASCETDLAREYLPHVYTRWLGNSVTTATRHYLQVTEQDFERATKRA